MPTPTLSCALLEDFRTVRFSLTNQKLFPDLRAFRLSDGTADIAISACSPLGVPASSWLLTLSQPVDLSKNHTLTVSGCGSATVLPGGIFDCAEFARRYHYTGTDLGAVITPQGTQFKVWAPTASAVELLLYRDGSGSPAYAALSMAPSDKGTFQCTANAPCGTYYTYRVSTAAGIQEAVDPYACTVGLNGQRGMVLDLASTDPAGWDLDKPVDTIKSYTDAVIWEVHIRDFSNAMEQSSHRGKYLAFTESGLRNSAGVPIGLDHVADLGITHVHLLPAFDYGSVDETGRGPRFNWGYDPVNYNSPEGSYASDPAQGQVRVQEFKEMVQALHKKGLGVVMDMVYNHTYHLDCCLHKIVPYYYHRFRDGKPTNGSGCGNETASERFMFRKYMVDSLCHWAKEYHLDGFRFDLMGLHDMQTMQQIEQRIHAINPKALLYGEGWTGGDTSLCPEQQANLRNTPSITATAGAAGGLAVFNDALRDGLKGSVFFSDAPGYVNGDPEGSVKAVLFGMLGGSPEDTVPWHSNAPTQVVNYTSCHDNLTLWDKLHLTCPNADKKALLQMNKLCAVAVFCAQGIPFIQAGEEMLRTKNGEHNSYASGDSINNLRWEALRPGTLVWEASRYYRGLIHLRRSCKALQQSSFGVRQHQAFPGGALSVLYIHPQQSALVVLNPRGPLRFSLPQGQWHLYANSQTAGTVPLHPTPFSGEITLEGCSGYIFLQA